MTSNSDSKPVEVTPVKYSAVGAGVGALVGCVGRATVVLLNIPPSGGPLASFALPSAGIGVLVGAIAGGFGKPLIGAVVGAVLSGIVFELFMCACSSLIGSFSQSAGEDFLWHTLRYGAEMAVAGAVAGGLGGLVGGTIDANVRPESVPPRSHDAKEEKQE